jgi:hypothetical protein
MKNSHNSPAKPEKQAAPASVQTVEPEQGPPADEGQSRQNEVLKHNVETGQQERHPATPAGQHATGSFTGSAKNPHRG